MTKEFQEGGPEGINSEPSRGYKLSEGGEYKIFERDCEKCGRDFTINVPNREPDYKFLTPDGAISVKQMEEKARRQKLCPTCEKKSESKAP